MKRASHSGARLRVTYAIISDNIKKILGKKEYCPNPYAGVSPLCHPLNRDWELRSRRIGTEPHAVCRFLRWVYPNARIQGSSNFLSLTSGWKLKILSCYMMLWTDVDGLFGRPLTLLCDAWRGFRNGWYLWSKKKKWRKQVSPVNTKFMPLKIDKFNKSILQLKMIPETYKFINIKINNIELIRTCEAKTKINCSNKCCRWHA